MEDARIEVELYKTSDRVNATACEVEELKNKLEQLKQMTDSNESTIALLHDEIHRNDPPEPPRAVGRPWDMPKAVLRPKQRKNKRHPCPRLQTVIKWRDGTVTHAAPDPNTAYHPYVGLMICCAKRLHELAASVCIAQRRTFGDCVNGVAQLDAEAGSPRRPWPEFYLRSVIGYAESVYARLSQRDQSTSYHALSRRDWDEQPATFTEWVRKVAEFEVQEIAKERRHWFTERLREMRRAVARPMAEARHYVELEAKRSAVAHVAEQNGASMFEAWKYARETVEDEFVSPLSTRITDEEKNEIYERSIAEAREWVRNCREFDLTLEVPF